LSEQMSNPYGYNNTAANDRGSYEPRTGFANSVKPRASIGPHRATPAFPQQMLQPVTPALSFCPKEGGSVSGQELSRIRNPSAHLPKGGTTKTSWGNETRQRNRR